VITIQKSNYKKNVVTDNKNKVHNIIYFKFLPTEFNVKSRIIRVGTL